MPGKRNLVTYGLVWQKRTSEKKDKHLIAFLFSRKTRTQVDFWVLRCSSYIIDCSVIYSESCLTQYKVLLLKLHIPQNVSSIIMWQSTEKSNGRYWKPFSTRWYFCWRREQVHTRTVQFLMRAKQGTKRIDRQIWCWNNKVQVLIKDKRTSSNIKK